MLDATLAWFWPDGMADLTHHKGEIVTHRPCDLYQLVDTLDGQLVYFLASQSQFEGMWRALGRDDLLADENFCNPGLLTRNRDAATEAQAAILTGLAQMTTGQAVEALAEHSAGRASTDPAQVFDDPQVIHNNLIVEWDLPNGETLLPGGTTGNLLRDPT